MQWPISRVARAAGTTSRALRHYEQVGLLAPTSVGTNGYRYYDDAALVRLQQIMLLRGLGMPLPEIAAVLAAQGDAAAELERHLQRLRAERQRLGEQIASVERTIDRLGKGEQIMPEDTFRGFDHTQHRAEVEQRWGRAAYADSDSWWRSQRPEQRETFMQRQETIAAGFAAARRSGLPADSDTVQDLARQQYEWLSGIPGTPQTEAGTPTREYFLGLADMYVSDARFTANYDRHEPGTAQLVRDAMRVFADRNL